MKMMWNFCRFALWLLLSARRVDNVRQKVSSVCKWIARWVSGERSALQINANDILFRFSVRLGWLLFFNQNDYVFCDESNRNGSAPDERMFAVWLTFAATRRHYIIRSINAWHYYDDVLFSRLFVWWPNFSFIYKFRTHCGCML